MEDEEGKDSQEVYHGTDTKLVGIVQEDEHDILAFVEEEAEHDLLAFADNFSEWQLDSMNGLPLDSSATEKK